MIHSCKFFLPLLLSALTLSIFCLSCFMIISIAYTVNCSKFSHCQLTGAENSWDLKLQSQVVMQPFLFPSVIMRVCACMHVCLHLRAVRALREGRETKVKSFSLIFARKSPPKIDIPGAPMNYHSELSFVNIVIGGKYRVTQHIFFMPKVLASFQHTCRSILYWGQLCRSGYDKCTRTPHKMHLNIFQIPGLIFQTVKTSLLQPRARWRLS